MQEGGEEGVAVKSFSCPVQLIVLCFFIQSHDKHTRFYFNLTLEYKAYYSSYTQKLIHAQQMIEYISVYITKQKNYCFSIAHFTL